MIRCHRLWTGIDVSKLRLSYLILAIVGAIVPMAHFLGWFALTGGGLTELFAAWFANNAVAGLAWDMMIAATALTIFMVYECMVKQDYLPLVCLVAIFAIGLSCALPLYLFLRSRPMA